MSNIVQSLDVRCFKVIGLWQFIMATRSKTNIYNAKYFVTMNAIMMCLILPYVCAQLFGSFGFYYDFDTLIEKLAVIITLVESIFKFLYCCTQRHHLGVLSQVFDKNFLISTQHSKHKSELILTESSRNLTRNINLFIVIIFATVGVWNSIPIFKCVMEEECDNLKIMPSWYPFTVNEAPIKQLVYILESLIMCYCASLLYNINCLLLSYAKLLGSQIQVLKLNLIHIEENSQKIVSEKLGIEKLNFIRSNFTNILHENMEALLKDCLTDHQKILRFASEMEFIFSPLFLFQIIVSTLTLCLVGVSLTAQAGNSANSTMSVAMAWKFVMYMIFGVMELFVYSWCGHIVTEQTRSLHDSFYETAWTTGSPKFHKHILMALTKTKFPSCISAGKFCSVDLGTFALVMRASFSYFTFLHGINSNK